MPKVRQLDVLDTDPFHITGRGGVVYTVIQPDPKIQCGEQVELVGNLWTVTGVESYSSIGGDDPGRMIGLLVVPMSDPEDSGRPGE